MARILAVPTPSTSSNAAAPVIAGKTVLSTTSEGVVTPFDSIVPASVTDSNAGAIDSMTIQLSGGGSGGTLSGTGLSGGEGGTYTLAPADAAIVTAELQALTFAPTKGQDNSSTTTTFKLTATSSAAPGKISAADSAFRVTDVDPAIAPTVVGGGALTTTSEGAIAPFATASVGDTNANSTDKLTIMLSDGGAGGKLSSQDVTALGNGVYTLAAPDAATLTSELRALQFTPTAGQVPSSTTTTFTLSDKASAFGTATSDDTTTVTNIDPGSAPILTGGGETATTSEKPVTPFAAASVVDAAGATETLTIALGGGGGTLAGAGLANKDGTYTLTGTAADVTAQLAAATFTPAAGLPNTSAKTTFTLTDQSSGSYAPVADSSTTVTDTDPAVAPTITGTAASQTTSEAPVSPFAGAVVADTNASATDTLTIALDGSGGSLAGAGPVNPDGTYTLTGTAAAVTVQLAAATFTPTAGLPGTTGITAFTLTDVSSAGTGVTDTATTVADADPALAPGAPIPPVVVTTPSTPDLPSGTTTPSTPDLPVDATMPSAPDAPVVTTTPSTPGAPVVATTPVNAVSMDPTVVFNGRGTFTLTGQVSGTAGVAGVELSALVDGQVQDLGAATVDANGRFSIVDIVGRHTQSFITATATDATGGTTTVDAGMSLTGGVRGEGHVAIQDSYSDGGDTFGAATSFRRDGSRTVAIQAGGQTFQSEFFDRFDNHGEGGNTFVFSHGYGHDTVKGFRATGEAHDTLDLPQSDFAGIADALRNTTDVAGGSVVHDPTSGDSIRLVGVTKEQLAKNTGDFSFHT